MVVYGDYRLKVFIDGKTEIYKNGIFVATYEDIEKAKSAIDKNKV